MDREARCGLRPQERLQTIGDHHPSSPIYTVKYKTAHPKQRKAYIGEDPSTWETPIVRDVRPGKGSDHHLYRVHACTARIIILDACIQGTLGWRIWGNGNQRDQSKPPIIPFLSQTIFQFYRKMYCWYKPSHEVCVPDLVKSIPLELGDEVTKTGNKDLCGLFKEVC